ncbi:C-terminal binding protein [Nocardioides sp. SYSU DS0663]|uniref:C-terminal binding protein n=1 Tax=Nocardioides sp. SYSU DS0663 TaxID=3416445 RepID=UPI003F4B199F
MENPASRCPAALYMGMDGLDVTPGHDLLRQHGIDILELSTDLTEDDLARTVALMVGYDPVDADLLERLPNLRVLATHSAGVDMVDVDAVRARDLWLANLPAGATDEVAVHALAMALALLRQLPAYDRAVRDGDWTASEVRMPRVPQELVVGVVGMGRIGQAMTSLCAGVFARVIGYDPTLPDELWPDGVERLATVEELLERSDCVSLHLPLNEDTRHLIDERRLALVPADAVVVNVARGELVDETALRAALGSGHLLGAGCDVLTNEPPESQDPIVTTPGVLVTPHVAYLSKSSLRRYAAIPAANVVAVLEQGCPLHAVVRPSSVEASTAP